MRPEYLEALQRADFQELSRTDPIVYAAIVADVSIIDLVVELAIAKKNAQRAYLDLARRTPLPPFALPLQQGG